LDWDLVHQWPGFPLRLCVFQECVEELDRAGRRWITHAPQADPQSLYVGPEFAQRHWHLSNIRREYLFVQRGSIDAFQSVFGGTSSSEVSSSRFAFLTQHSICTAGRTTCMALTL